MAAGFFVSGVTAWCEVGGRAASIDQRLRRGLAFALRAGRRVRSLATSDSSSSTRRFSSMLSSAFAGTAAEDGGGGVSAPAVRAPPGTGMNAKGFSGEGMER